MNKSGIAINQTIIHSRAVAPMGRVGPVRSVTMHCDDRANAWLATCTSCTSRSYSRLTGHTATDLKSATVRTLNQLAWYTRRIISSGFRSAICSESTWPSSPYHNTTLVYGAYNYCSLTTPVISGILVHLVQLTWLYPATSIIMVTKSCPERPFSLLHHFDFRQI